MEKTLHFAYERQNREDLIKSIGGSGKVILTNIIDRGHPNGAERFELTEKGIIYVYNVRTNRQITVLFARVGQLYSRFGNKFDELPSTTQEGVKTYCRKWKMLGYNER